MMLRRLGRDRRGGAGLIVAGMMPVLVGFTAFAVDLGAVQLDTRRLQGMADAAALAAATAPADATVRAQALVNGSGFPRQVSVTATAGTYSLDPAVAPAARFTAGGTKPHAVRVVLESSSPTFFARIFGTRDVTIVRAATARRQNYAAFSIGSRLASLNGGILNNYLTALTGSSISLSVMDYQALAAADVDLLGYLPILRTELGLNALTFNELLATQAATPKLLNALVHALTRSGQTAAANALSSLLTLPGGQSIALNALIDAGAFGNQTNGGGNVSKVNALAMVTAILQLANKNRQVSLDSGVAIDGVAKTTVLVGVGERTQQSPWVTITDNGAPIVRTAQTRVYVKVDLLPSSLLGTSASVKLPILLEAASAEGRLKSIDCSNAASRGVTLEGKTNLLSAGIGTIDESRINDFSTPLTPARANLVDVKVLGLGLVTVSGHSTLSLGAAEPWQNVPFTAAQIGNGTRKTIASSTPVGGIASSLINSPGLRVTLLGLPIRLDSLLTAVGGLLTPLASPLDTLLMTVTGTLGVGLGEADLQVTGMRCGQPVLVA